MSFFLLYSSELMVDKFISKRTTKVAKSRAMQVNEEIAGKREEETVMVLLMLFDIVYTL